MKEPCYSQLFSKMLIFTFVKMPTPSAFICSLCCIQAIFKSVLLNPSMSPPFDLSWCPYFFGCYGIPTTEQSQFCFSVAQHQVRGSQNADDMGQCLGPLTSGNPCWWPCYSYLACFLALLHHSFSKSLCLLWVTASSVPGVNVSSSLICDFTGNLEASSVHLSVIISDSSLAAFINLHI